MTPQHLEQLLRQEEGVTLEFKQSRDKLNRDVYETICAFLNRQGGTLLLGVADNGTVCGIEQDAVTRNPSFPKSGAFKASKSLFKG
ncbi:MAG: ATP-binding protein [Desulfuromonadales bacterium]|nr:ATP-binding protein [Desulfuromonadales bacterium]